MSTSAKRGKKRSRAKRYAEIERISIFGAESRIGPVGLWLYADAFASAAQKMGEPDAKFEPVRYYLACHSIELGLKAFLSLHEVTMLELSENPFGHDLQAILDAAQGKGLTNSVHLSAEQQAEIRKATAYYNGKLFEYPAYGEAMQGYPLLPNLSILIDVAMLLAGALAKPCREAS
jgi:hypothetical protein